LTLLAGLISFNACADIVISGTRVIYPQAAKDVTVNLENKGNKPLLIQSWLDDGRDNVNPQELKLPFIITPPVTRVDAHKGQSIRITWLGQALPQDRESLFWLNVLEVPPKAQNASTQNLLQVAFRTRIKLFFRPTGLKGTPEAAVKGLKWSVNTQSGNSWLTARNDSAYNVSIASASFNAGGKTWATESHSIKPFSSESMKIKGSTAPKTGTVKFVTINDFGGTTDNQAAVN
jgi:chaperone protein EcpD